MEFLNQWLLTILIFLPTAGALAVLVAPKQQAKWVSLGATALTFLLSLLLLVSFDWKAGIREGETPDDAAKRGLYAYNTAAGESNVVQMVQRASWIKAFNIEYLVGMDGLSFPLVILTTFVCLLSCVASWNIDKMAKGYFALFLFLETGILGVFLALDFFLFYVFFEVSLLPMYFLIGIWGGPRKEYAAIKFFLYTLVGSIGLLIVLIGTYLYSRQIERPIQVDGTVQMVPAFPNGTFDLITLASVDVQKGWPDPVTQERKGGLSAQLPFGLSGTVAKVFFFLLMVGFLIKVPAVPVHTWLPDAHVEAPTPISMILAAILLKMGGYGIFRIAYPLYPDAAKELWLVFAIIGVVSIIYGALCAMSQTDFKKLVAYSSVSHMGFVTLGAAMMTEASVNGALFMMIAHGVVSAMLFFIVGVIYERAHHREIARFGGIATTMPVYTGLAQVGFFANLGLPGLAGFVGEVMVLLGSFQAARDGSIIRTYAASRGWPDPYACIMTLAVIACFGVVLTAGYMLWTIQRVYLGPEKSEYKGFSEVDARELSVLTPLAIFAILLGILPTFFVFAYTNQTVAALFGLFRA